MTVTNGTMNGMPMSHFFAIEDAEPISGSVPLFPEFKQLEITDQETVERYLSVCPPSCDFTFATLWGWHEPDTTRISLLNGNLVLCCSDYFTDRKVVSFLGKAESLSTLRTLLEWTRDGTSRASLSWIPGFSLASISPWPVWAAREEQRENFDYVYDVARLSTMAGHTFSRKRRLAERFARECSDSAHVVDVAHPETQASMQRVFHDWAVSRGRGAPDIARELQAFNRVLSVAQYLRLICVASYLKGSMVSFSLAELLPRRAATTLFSKADTRMAGIFEYTRRAMARELQKLGVKYLNAQDDLGSLGMRQSKLAYRPRYLLKKYHVRAQDEYWSDL